MRWWAPVALGLAVWLSAATLVYAKHESRRLFVELNALHQERDALEIEWGRLQLEQSTWATNGRVEQVAREALHMRMPPPEAVVIIKP